MSRWDRRNVLLVVAAVALVLVVAIEVGAGFVLSAVPADEGALREALAAEGITGDERDAALEQLDEVAEAGAAPGKAIPALALVDLFLLLTFGTLAAASVVPHRVLARINAPANLVAAIVVILIGIVLLVITIALLLLMVSLFVAVPFGTITYLVRWGFFPRAGAQTVLGILLILKLVAVVAAVAASPRILTNKGPVALVCTSLIIQLVVGFLLALVPLPLVSIADAIAAVVVIIVAIIWAIVILIGSIGGTIKALKPLPD
jgi:hypothetical protein